MALIIEDGTMPAGANSYAAVADCDGWQGARGSTIWPAPPAEPDNDLNLAAKEAALIKATDYLNGLGWNGKRAPGGRVMAWPRIGAVDADGYSIDENTIPGAVQAACCYLAGVAYSGTDLQPILERGGRIQSESVGSLSTSYFQDAANRDIYSVLADLLHGLASEFDDYAGTASGNGKPKTTMATAVLA